VLMNHKRVVRAVGGLWRGTKALSAAMMTLPWSAFGAEGETGSAAGQKPMTFNYGGQAVIEGVMMRGQYNAAVAVRKWKYRLKAEPLADGGNAFALKRAMVPLDGRGKPQKRWVSGLKVGDKLKSDLDRDRVMGEIVIKEVPLNAALYRGRIARLPFVRGLVLLWDSLGLGTRALMWSADVQLEEEEDVDLSLEGAAGMGLVAVSLAMGIGLFFVLPAAGSAAVKELAGIDSKLAADVVEGFIKLGMLTGYIWLIGHMEDVRRLFGYHGAEHKTINAYEAGAELTPPVVAQYPIEHPRCGTAFLLTLVVLSVLIHIVTGRPDGLVALLLSRVGLILPIAGLAYETIRFTAKHGDNWLIKQIIKPNLALQHLTTNPPDETMLEVGIASLQRVLAAERAGVPVKDTVISEIPAASAGD